MQGLMLIFVEKIEYKKDVYKRQYQSEAPTLKDLYRQLMLQPEEEARGLALSSELFINGSLNTFAQKTNVDTKNRIKMCIRDRSGSG